MEQTADRADPFGASERQTRLALAAQAAARSGLRIQRAERLARLRVGGNITVPPGTGVAPTIVERAPAARPTGEPLAGPTHGAARLDAPSRGLDTAGPHQALPVSRTIPLASEAGPATVPDGIPSEEAEGARMQGLAPADARLERPRETEADDPVMSDEDVEALERFLVGLVGALGTEPPPPQPARLAPVVSFERPAAAEVGLSGEPAGAGELSHLPGVGPGLVAALVRAGVPDLRTLAAADPVALAGKLGAIARLLDLPGWVAFARDATAAEPPAIGKSA